MAHKAATFPATHIAGRPVSRAGRINVNMPNISTLYTFLFFTLVCHLQVLPYARGKETNFRLDISKINPPPSRPLAERISDCESKLKDQIEAMTQALNSASNPDSLKRVGGEAVSIPAIQADLDILKSVVLPITSISKLGKGIITDIDMNKKEVHLAEAFFSQLKQWEQEYELLRAIATIYLDATDTWHIETSSRHSTVREYTPVHDKHVNLYTVIDTRIIVPLPNMIDFVINNEPRRLSSLGNLRQTLTGLLIVRES
ncbi:hypothetical protein CVT24_002302 [Panaeolus cyanescens]|uniref:Uncharacterized protein n=1 Tax=Panaeolus cyanescens TaxID=181874 RepID=A0A409YIR5_9AGAR|nr:hypothetical protein CVT24_002302 [Panaeolus cyanescens]